MNNQVIEIPNEELESHYRIAVNKYGQKVYVPVVVVTDGPAERALGEQIIKAANQSKYIRYNEYHVSRKKPKPNDSQV